MQQRRRRTNVKGGEGADDAVAAFSRHTSCAPDDTTGFRVCAEENRVFRDVVEDSVRRLQKEEERGRRTWVRGVPDVSLVGATPLFRLLRAMPKGALLHAHFPAMVGWSKFLTAVLRAPELHGKVFYLRDPRALRNFVENDPYLRRDKASHVWNAPSGYTKNALTVFPDAPSDPPPGWQLLTRSSAEYIATQMASSHSWDTLRRNNSLPWSLIKNVEVFELYFRMLLEEAIADGVQHVELKTNLGNLHVKYDRRRDAKHYEGRWLTQQDEIDAMSRVYDDPRWSFASRITFRLILGAHRSAPPEVVENRLDGFVRTYKANRGVVGGVDIFGREEGSRSNEAFMRPLRKTWAAVREAQQEGREADRDDFVFSVHSGETADVEYPVDRNLAALLRVDDAARIRVGHGLSLWKYPRLERMFASGERERKHIEACPLSNVILGYVDRTSNHPGLRYFLADIPVSISSDDPAYFGYDHVSYDWFAAVVAWNLQLQDVVRLCMASVQASAMSRADRDRLARAHAEAMRLFLTEMMKK